REQARLDIQQELQKQLEKDREQARLDIQQELQKQLEKELEQSRLGIQQELQKQLEKELEQARLGIRQELQKQFAEEFKNRGADSTDVTNEIGRVATQLECCAKEIIAMLDDPSIELSKVMRKRTEQAELKAYLNGLRFS